MRISIGKLAGICLLAGLLTGCGSSSSPTGATGGADAGDARPSDAGGAAGRGSGGADGGAAGATGTPDAAGAGGMMMGAGGQTGGAGDAGQTDGTGTGGQTGAAGDAGQTDGSGTGGQTSGIGGTGAGGQTAGTGGTGAGGQSAGTGGAGTGGQTGGTGGSDAGTNVEAGASGTGGTSGSAGASGSGGATDDAAAGSGGAGGANDAGVDGGSVDGAAADAGVEKVSSITVTSSGGATSLTIGATLQLSASVLPAGAAQAVTWSTSAPAIAAVSAGGLVSGSGIGPVTITATATDGSGVSGSILLNVTSPNVISLVKQTPATGTATITASLTGGTIAVTHTYTTSSNAFKFISPNYYGTSSNGFLALPTPVTGDFTISATVTVNVANKNNNACGIGVGLTTGFAATDRYAYILMTNPTTTATTANATPRYVSSATNVTNAGAPAFPFAVGQNGTAMNTATPLNLYFQRVGTTVNIGIVGTTTVLATSALTDGTNVYGNATVYPALSFNNVNATITNLLVQDGAGNTLFDSNTGALITQPAALTLSSPTATVSKGQTTTVTATGTQAGGAVATVTVTPADTSIVTATVQNNATSSIITLAGQRSGTTTVSVVNGGDVNPATNTKTITVTVIEFNAADGYGSLAGRVYPAPAAPAAYADGELSLTFDSAPTLNAGGSIDIYKADGSLADRIFFASETQTVAGVIMQVGSQLVRVSGNTVYFTPHFGKILYATSYYVGISTTAITGTLNAQTFTGLSNLSAVATWNFTALTAPALFANGGLATVNVDGSQTNSTQDFRTVGGALMYLAANPIAAATQVNVNVAAGTYIELVNYRAAVANPGLTIYLTGPAGNNRGDNALIQYTNGGNLNSQNGRASFYFAGANLVLQNLTLKNTGVRAVVAQAEAMYFDSRAGFTMAANNCSFSSFQDTIQTSGRTWIYNSYIEGNTDFLWGTADASLFESCNLHVLSDSPGQTYSIFVARTGATGAATIGKGYVLENSAVSVDGGIFASYGRDAGQGSFYDQAALINNTFSGSGQLTTGLWVTTTAPLSLGDSTFVGWKAQGNSGLGADSMATAAGTANSIASAATEYNTRENILNHVVTVAAGAPTGFANATSTWNLGALETLFGAH